MSNMLPWDPDTAPNWEKFKDSESGEVPLDLRGHAFDSATARLQVDHEDETETETPRDKIDRDDSMTRYMYRKQATLLHSRICGLKAAYSSDGHVQKEPVSFIPTSLLVEGTNAGVSSWETESGRQSPKYQPVANRGYMVGRCKLDPGLKAPGFKV